jgi:hypothetical protein
MKKDLSELILGRQFAAAERALIGGADPNYHDQYGTTPLINAVLMNHEELVKKLLKHHAKVDTQDSSGHTALFWAVDNHNLGITATLLHAKANPNGFNANGQPILVYPFLRKQVELKQLLIDAGGDLTFAQDYVYAKLLGHRFELTGTVNIASPEPALVEMDYEGFLPEFSIAGINESLKQLLHHYSGRTLKEYFPYVEDVIQALDTAHQLRLLKHRNTDLQAVEKKVDHLLTQHPFLIIPVTFSGHAITFVYLSPYLAHCDRGERSETHDAVTLYQALRPSQLNTALFKRLLYQTHTKRFIHSDLHRELHLTPIESIPTNSQISGNCSWANVEASIPTLMFMLMRAKNPAVSTHTVQKAALAFYHAWREWDKDLALSLCIEHFKEGNRVRQVSKANQMAAIVFQRTDPKNPIDMARAKKILPYLMDKTFQPILGAYAKTYCYDLSIPQAKTFAQVLKGGGVDYRTLM